MLYLERCVSGASLQFHEFRVSRARSLSEWHRRSTRKRREWIWSSDKIVFRSHITNEARAPACLSIVCLRASIQYQQEQRDVRVSCLLWWQSDDSRYDKHNNNRAFGGAYLLRRWRLLLHTAGTWTGIDKVLSAGRCQLLFLQILQNRRHFGTGTYHSWIG